MLERFVQANQTLLCGPGGIEELPEQLSALGVTRPYLVTTTRAGTSEAAACIREALRGVEVAGEFGSVREHAPLEGIETVRDRLQDTGADSLISIGGGSASDTAKAAALLLAGRPLAINPPLDPALDREPLLPLLAVSTTLTAAEMTSGGGYIRDGHKEVFAAPDLPARVVVYDPRAIATTPSPVLLGTAMNGLAHCLEGGYTPMRSAVTDALGREGARLFARGILALSGGDRGAPVLQTLQTAAQLSGLVLGNARVAIHHSICHVLGGDYGLSHGEANTVMLPYAMAFNEPASATVQREFAEAIAPELAAAGVSSNGDRSLAGQIATLQRATGLATNLRKAGLQESDLPKLVDSVVAREPSLSANPRPADHAGISELVSMAWHGDLNG